MLDANLFGRGTGGASVALEPDSGTLMLSRSWSLGGSESGELLRGFSAFVGATEAWKTRIDDAFWRDPDAQPPAEPPGAATPTVVKVQPRLP